MFHKNSPSGIRRSVSGYCRLISEVLLSDGGNVIGHGSILLLLQKKSYAFTINPMIFTHIVFIYWYNIALYSFETEASNGKCNVDHITKEFGEVVAVNDLNLAIDDKEFHRSRRSLRLRENHCFTHVGRLEEITKRRSKNW